MKERKLYDVSLTIRPSMQTWPGGPGFERSYYSSFDKGDPYDASAITMSSHTGTHVDAPAHFLHGGPTIDTIPLDTLVGEVVVFKIDVENEITASELERLDFTGVERVIFKTRNSALYQSDEFSTDFVHLTIDAATYLVEKGVRLVGIDYLSVGEFESGANVHEILLSSGVVVVETLDLSEIEPRRYELFCLPLKIEGGDGSPARVFLRDL